MVKDELLRHGFKYDKGLYNGGKEGRGGWKGFRLADNTSSLPAPTVNVENEQVLAAQQATADPLHVTDGNWQGADDESEDDNYYVTLAGARSFWFEAARAYFCLFLGLSLADK